jgi:hypothetical protein
MCLAQVITRTIGSAQEVVFARMDTERNTMVESFSLSKSQASPSMDHFAEVCTPSFHPASVKVAGKHVSQEVCAGFAAHTLIAWGFAVPVGMCKGVSKDLSRHVDTKQDTHACIRQAGMEGEWGKELHNCSRALQNRVK